jgi:hypothetical protein
MSLLDKILERVKQQERIERMKFEQQRRNQILESKKMYIENISETKTTNNGAVKIRDKHKI